MQGATAGAWSIDKDDMDFSKGPVFDDEEAPPGEEGGRVKS